MQLRVTSLRAIKNGNRRTAWTPAQLPGLALWLDAADTSTITLNGLTVSQWNDKSGNNRHAAQATAAAQPTSGTKTINGLNAIDFDGSSDFLTFPGIDIVNKDVFIVFNTDVLPTPSNPGMVMAEQAFFLQMPRVQFDGSIIHAGGFWENTPVGTSFISSVGQPVLFNAQATDPTLLYVVNGTAYQSYAKSASADVRGTILQGLGARSHGIGGENFYNGQVAEVVFANAPSAADRQKVEGYLAWKWGLEANLPAGHPYKATPPLV